MMMMKCGGVWMRCIADSMAQGWGGCLEMVFITVGGGDAGLKVEAWGMEVSWVQGMWLGRSEEEDEEDAVWMYDVSDRRGSGGKVNLQ